MPGKLILVGKLILAGMCCLQVATAANWYVSITGLSTNSGTLASPWDINSALAGHSGAVQPGDTIWLQGGTYGDGTVTTVIYSTTVGTSVSPIVVRGMPGQRAIINNWLQVGCCDGANDPSRGSYTWFWDLEFDSYNTNRSSGTSGPPDYAAMFNHNGIDTWGDGTKVINCLFDNLAGGISVWTTNNSEVYGNLLSNIGGHGTDRGHGHDLYLQNNSPSNLVVTNNIGFNNFDEGIQAYGSSTAYVQNMTFTGNVIFNSGTLNGDLVDNFTIGGGGASGGANNITLTDNYTYDTPSLTEGQNELGDIFDSTEGTGTFTGNYFIGGFQAADLDRWTTLTFTGNTLYATTGAQQSWMLYTSSQNPATYTYTDNTYYGVNQFWIFANCGPWPCTYTENTYSEWQSILGIDAGSTYDSSDPPPGTWTFVTPNSYETGRANIIIYNWPLASTVSVNLTAVGMTSGTPYQILDAENIHNGPVASGIYTTGSPSVTIPMTGLTVEQPVGTVPNPPSHTAPQFGVFVVMPVGGLGPASVSLGITRRVGNVVH